MSREVKNFINDPDIPKNPMAVLWWKYFRKKKLSIARWNVLLNIFLRSKFANIEQTSKMISQTRSNTNRSIFNEKGILSWNRLRKGVLISGSKRMSLILESEEHDGSTIRVKTTIDNKFYDYLVEQGYFENYAIINEVTPDEDDEDNDQL